MRGLSLFVVPAAAFFASGPLSAQSDGAEACAGTWLLSYRPATTALYDLAKWTPGQQKIAAAHGAYLDSLDKKGTIAFAGRAFEFEAGGRLSPRSVALVILRAADRKAAAALSGADPAVAGGLFATEISCFELVYPGKAG